MWKREQDFNMKQQILNLLRFESTYFHVSILNFKTFPAGIYLRKVSNRNTRIRCEICSKLTIETLEQGVKYVQS